MQKKNVSTVLLVVLGCLLIGLLYNQLHKKNSKESTHTSNESLEYKGVAISLFDSNNNDGWYDEKLPKIRSLGAGLQVVTAVTVQSKNDSLPVNDPRIDEKFQRLFAKSKQYEVPVTMIKPHIMLPGFRDNFDRGTYEPSDINTFFEKWKQIILYYAAVSSENDVPILSITCETPFLTQNIYVARWQDIIKEIHLKYPQLKVTMSFKMSELDRELVYHEQGLKAVSAKLDYIGLNMYPIVKRFNNNTVLKANDDAFLIPSGAKGYIYDIKKAKKYFNKDTIITETGASPRSNKDAAYLNPAVLDETKPKDYIDQNQWVKTVLEVLLQTKEVKGVYMWHMNPPFDFLDSPTSETVKESYKN